MKTFRVKTPDGNEVEVLANTPEDAQSKVKKDDAWKGMPKIIFKGSDNVRIFERPNGQRYLVSPGFTSSNPETIEKVLKGATAGEASTSGFDQSTISQAPVVSKLTQFIKGVPFLGSYADEAMGLLGGEDKMETMRTIQSAMERERPKETAALNLAGAAVGSVPMALAAPARAVSAISGPLNSRNLLTIPRGVATGAGIGSLEGAVYGAGEGTDPESRLSKAKTTALYGAGGGAVIGAAAPIAAKGIRNIANVIRRSDIALISSTLKISRDAAKVIKNTFTIGGDIDAALSAVKKAGDEGMLADAGPAAQALLDASSAGGGQAAQTVNTALNRRMQSSGQALDANLNATLGEAPVGPRTAVEAIAERTAEQRSILYGEAYSTPIDYASSQGDEISSVLSKTPDNVMSQAVIEANEEILMGNLPGKKQIKVVVGEDGNLSFSELPNVMQLDELKKALQGIARENVDQFGRLTAKGVRYDRLAGELRDAVSGAVPVYGDAVKLGGDKIAEEGAFQIGADLLKSSTELEDVIKQFGPNTPSAQLDAAKQGLRRYIEKAIGDVRAIASDPTAEALDARQVIKIVSEISSKNSRKKIRSLLGAEADALLKRVDEAAQSAAVRAATSVNSKTAQRTAIRETVSEITEPGIIGTAMKGEPLNTSRRVVQAITGQTDEFTAAQKQRIFEDIARALTEKKGKTAQEALRLISKAMDGQAITEAQSTFLAQQISLISLGSTAPTASRAARDVGE
tara:strand:- start:48 stop:2279 length:2232 start_codon:yes stop_codon:yes gene_type:complete